MSEMPKASALRRWWWRAATWQRLFSTTGGTLAVLALVSAAMSLPVAPPAPADPLAAPNPVSPLSSPDPVTPSPLDSGQQSSARPPAWASKSLTVSQVHDANTITGTTERGDRVTVQVKGAPRTAETPGCAKDDVAKFAEKELLGKQVGLLDLVEGTDGAAARIFTSGHEYSQLLNDFLAHCRKPTGTPAPAAPPSPSPQPNSQGGGGAREPGDPTANTPTPSEPAPHYKNCAQVRKAGKAPLLRDQPGYRPELDKDGDGVACDR
ncbi:hypothetical protein JOF53_004094 [Crossiella equi]|uniref:Excalibur calcium-binding domain-containing protein n=1 Tax=Crossiella equi TaxID=130796 RepID=A0ABS5AF66_9PSEU|nr:excalibur calcium-binding domain-containing protein [Crossiella equi]MBP2475222.1 hypothetical protein [Crossiella equi]